MESRTSSVCSNASTIDEEINETIDNIFIYDIISIRIINVNNLIYDNLYN